MEKEAAGSIPILSDLWSAGKDTAKAGAELGVELYKHIDKLAWLLIPTVGGLAVVGGVNALTPKAVAKNADRYAGLEAIKASLAASIRERQALEQQRRAELEYNGIKRHDKFTA